MATRLVWAEAIQKALGVDPYSEGSLALVNIFVAEGSKAADNPTDTIQPEPGATPFNTFDNSLHVWNYPSFQEGLDAVVATLNQPLNSKVVEALRAKSDAEIITAAVATGSSWDGAGSLYLRTLPEVRAAFAADAGVEVPGAGPVVAPAPAPATWPFPAPTPAPAPVPEVVQIENAVTAQAKQVDAAAVAGKASALRTLVSELETHLSELEDLVKGVAVK
jgi:hypothetical protein